MFLHEPHEVRYRNAPVFRAWNAVSLKRTRIEPLAHGATCNIANSRHFACGQNVFLVEVEPVTHGFAPLVALPQQHLLQTEILLHMDRRSVWVNSANCAECAVVAKMAASLPPASWARESVLGQAGNSAWRTYERDDVSCCQRSVPVCAAILPRSMRSSHFVNAQTAKDGQRCGSGRSARATTRNVPLAAC